MQKIIGTALGKGLRAATRLRRGAGQALPGLVIERLFPRYFAKMLQQLPEGVIVITGTNGKTTTTKMVVELLRANGKRVLTNPTGSNLTRGINSTLIHQAKATGHLPFDIAVLELDEAYARQFVRQIAPRWVVALNVTRDQLDRFGEVDTAAQMIIETMQHASAGVVTNADDPRLSEAAKRLEAAQVSLFGVDKALQDFFPSDDELVAVSARNRYDSSDQPADVQLVSFHGQTVTYRLGGKNYTADLQLNGQHNFQNAAAALALTMHLIPQLDPKTLMTQLADVRPAFGRGEQFSLKNGSTVRVVLVKNPAGFRQSMASFLPAKAAVMIAINDNIADGRDLSWLWDVDFAPLQRENIALVTGKRAADMALRLSYDNISVQQIEPDLLAALQQFASLPGDKLLFTTYTAMLRFHQLLSERAGKTL